MSKKDIDNKALDTRKKIEFALRILFDCNKEETKIGKYIKELKQNFNITKNEQLRVKSLWNISSKIIHEDYTKKLVEEEIEFVLNLLRDIMMKKCNYKKEYIVDGIACYKLLFNKRLMKELKRNNIVYNGYPRTKSEKEDIWGFETVDTRSSIFGQFLDNDIYIPKCLFDSLTTTPKQTMCLIEARTEDGYSQKIGLALKNDFNINKLCVCSEKLYYGYNDTIDEYYDNNIEILVDIDVLKEY